MPVERRAISMSSTSFLLPKTIFNTEITNKGADEEIVYKLSEEVKYFKKQHQFLAEKLKKSEELFIIIL